MLYICFFLLITIFFFFILSFFLQLMCFRISLVLLLFSFFCHPLLHVYTDLLAVDCSCCLIFGRQAWDALPFQGRAESLWASVSMDWKSCFFFFFFRLYLSFFVVDRKSCFSGFICLFFVCCKFYCPLLLCLDYCMDSLFSLYCLKKGA